MTAIYAIISQLYHNYIMQYMQDNTLVLLIEMAAPLKKPSSETTYFELLVLAFRVFEFRRSKADSAGTGEEARSEHSIKSFTPNVCVLL